MTQPTKQIAFIEHTTHPEEFVTIIERFEPCNDYERPTALFGRWPNFEPMKLVSRRTEDGREI